MQSRKRLFRQGDVLFTVVDDLPDGDRKARSNGMVAYGEVPGHTHALAVEDRHSAEVLEIAGGLFVRVSETGLSVEN